MYLDFPYHFDSRGRTAQTNLNDHIRHLIEQVLFTAPGERVNRPEFGSGIMLAVFAPNSTEMAAATQFLVQGALQQALSDLIELNNVDVEADNNILRVTIEYIVRETQQQQTAEFTQGGLAQ